MTQIEPRGKNTKPFDLIFLDPPYRKQLLEPVLITLLECQWLMSDSSLIAEMAHDESLSVPASYAVHMDRVYGQTRIMILSVL
jgi:16S rRNA (guanine966-N2)-methyltransferase